MPVSGILSIRITSPRRHVAGRVFSPLAGRSLPANMRGLGPSALQRDDVHGRSQRCSLSFCGDAVGDIHARVHGNGYVVGRPLPRCGAAQ